MNKTGHKAVTELALFLKRATIYTIYKDDDRRNVDGEYIALNHLAWVFGKPLNDVNTINLNIHVPELNSGGANRIRMNEILDDIMSLIPTESDDEEDSGLVCNGFEFTISSISNPMEDMSDKSYFYNIRIKTRFING